MTWQDRKRLTPETFEIDPRMRSGYYSDAYFRNVVGILEQLSAEGYRFGGECPRLEDLGVDVGSVNVGDIEVEMQIFTRREPFTVACGTDYAVAMLKECMGYFDSAGEFHNTFAAHEIESVHDGDILRPWIPAVKIRGRYRDFAILETVVLGPLARLTRVATNTYECLQASGGKPVFMFGPRYDIPAAQPGDGYAYKIGVDRYNADTGANALAMITTDAQGSWWGDTGGGTTSHSLVLSFLGDTREAMLQFARLMPVEVKRIALVDTNNDSVGTTVRCAKAFFSRYMELIRAGKRDEARKYVLFGVRCDTAGERRDVAVEPTGDSSRDNGVVPRLVSAVRDALDSLADDPEIPAEDREEADRYFRDVRIVASGGFNPRRIAWFERENAPVDVYGIGSFLQHGPTNDFIADVVRVKIDGKWFHMAKAARESKPNPDLEKVV
ncbi:MAG: nicotinate phosphoribosyltransferase [Planctomycetota bacterium]